MAEPTLVVWKGIRRFQKHPFTEPLCGIQEGMKGPESDQNQNIWNLLVGSVDLEASIGIYLEYSCHKSHQEMCGCPMPSAGIDMNELA